MKGRYGRRLSRAILRHPLARRILARLAAFYIALVWRCARWRWEGAERIARLIADKRPCLVAFWHGRLLMIAPIAAKGVKGGRQVDVLISHNRDGALIARTMAHFGVGVVYGSSRDARHSQRDKGGDAALRALRRRLEGGAIIGITPDGPRGPRQIAQPGVAALSLQTGAPVLPLSYAHRRAFRLKSWDRFMLPLPLFTRAACVAGALIEPPAMDEKDALERHRQAIEAGLNSAQARADALVRQKGEGRA